MASRTTKPQTSILEVATLAQVSTATVSRVLSGRRTKDDDIAQRVRKAAEELHYSVNHAASALRSDVTNTLEKMMDLHPCSRMTSTSTRVPSMLLW